MQRELGPDPRFNRLEHKIEQAEPNGASFETKQRSHDEEVDYFSDVIFEAMQQYGESAAGQNLKKNASGAEKVNVATSAGVGLAVGLGVGAAAAAILMSGPLGLAVGAFACIFAFGISFFG